MNNSICGIDYGSRLAGTTVIAIGDSATKIVSFQQSKPKQDADAFLLEIIQERRPAAVFIDAPLSLPGVYGQIAGCEDYFYRAADKALQAMSPMFLGGLTARAMRLKNLLEKTGIVVCETYPAAQAWRLELQKLGYKQSVESIGQVLAFVQLLFPSWVFESDFLSWHQIDALLAWIAAHRFAQNEVLTYGDEKEGLIYV